MHIKQEKTCNNFQFICKNYELVKKRPWSLTHWKVNLNIICNCRIFSIYLYNEIITKSIIKKFHAIYYSIFFINTEHNFPVLTNISYQKTSTFKCQNH